MTNSNFPNARMVILLTLAPLACNQPSPPGSDDDAGSESMGDSTSASETGDTTADTTADTTDTGTVDEPLCAMVDGAQWNYVVTNTGGQVLGMDNTQASDTTWQGGPGWELTDSPDAMGESSVSTLIQTGDRLVRVHREEMDQVGTTAIIDYDPGFVRCSEAWTTVGVVEEYLYDRTEYDGNGLNPNLEPRGHTFEVVAIDQEITVPAGTFNCVKVERVRTVGTEAGALAWFWFAPGVGKVREERPLDMEIEELVSVSIPGGANLP